MTGMRVTRTSRHFLFALLGSILIACGGSQAADNVAAYASVKITGVPHVQQKPDFCGEACAEMWLRKLGHKITQNDVFNLSGVDPLSARGCHTTELAKALKAIGFDVGNVWCKIPAKSDAAIAKQWEQLHADLVKGIPSIICMRTSRTRDATEHFRLVLGYHPDTREIIYHEPAAANGSYRRMKLVDLLACWPLKYSAGTWTIIRLRLKSAKITRPKPSTGFTNADYVQHMMELKKRMPAKGFTAVLQKPFVVLGDESPAMVRRRAAQTVKWATDRLKTMYFKKDPDAIIDIWLFKDDASYRKHAWSIFRDKPDTPFGYSSSVHNALIMNIATGGGTLVHEIVHPLMAANFPECPSWLNEGMGSLYEQSSGRGKQIIGLTNWRLAGLQRAIKKGQVPSFKTLLSTSEHEFYSEDPGTNYAQARYLCYYLQEKGLLTKFYHEFHANQKDDPTGYKTLMQVLRLRNMDAFRTKWEKYVLALRF